MTSACEQTNRIIRVRRASKTWIFDEKYEVEYPNSSVFEMVTLQLGKKAGIHFGVLRWLYQTKKNQAPRCKTPVRIALQVLCKKRKISRFSTKKYVFGLWQPNYER